MTNVVTDLVVEEVPGADWILAYRPGYPSLVVSPAAPWHASPALIDALRLRWDANVTGRCLSCDAVAQVHPELKTMPPDEVAALFGSPVDHYEDCPAHVVNVTALDRACSPTGEVTAPDVSDIASDILVAYLERRVPELRSQHAASTEGDFCD